MNSFQDMTLKSLFETSVEKYADYPALSYADSEPMTYKQVAAKVKDVTAFLLKRGILAGDRVAILSENKPNWGIAYLAIATMGAVAVPILPEFHENEVHHILRHSGSKAIFISEKQFDKLESGSFTELSTISLIDDFSLIPPSIKKDMLKNVISDGVREFNKIKDSALKTTGFRPKDVSEEDVAVIIYTSGTTGHSKGVMLTHKNLVSNALMAASVQDVTPQDRLISILPLSHTYENTLGFVLVIMGGASVYYLDKPPTSRVLLPAMQKIKPTMMLSVPLVIEKIFKMRILPQLTKNALMRKMYESPMLRKKLHKAAGKKLMKSFGNELIFFGIGGALLSADVERFLREAGFPYAIGYGLTETSPLLAGCNPANTRFRSTGPAVRGVEIKLHNPDPKTGEGEIWARGDNIMKGYYKDPEKTEQVLTKDGWFKTGDLAMLDSDGYVFIKGRLKNVIIGPSGENIYPEEIEDVLNEDENVLESLVFEQEGQLIARVHLNYEELDIQFTSEKLTQTQVEERIKALLNTIRDDVNSKLSSISRISKILEQTEPFEKTPTHKIKRYLYITT